MRDTQCVLLWPAYLLKEGCLLFSEDERDLEIAVLLVLGGTSWNEKIPHKELGTN